MGDVLFHLPSVLCVLLPGLPRDHPESYHSFMWNNFFKHIDISPENVHILDGNAPDLQAECDAFEKKIKAAGGIELFVGGENPRAAASKPCPKAVPALPSSHLLPGLFTFCAFAVKSTPQPMALGTAVSWQPRVPTYHCQLWVFSAVSELFRKC